MVCFQADSRGSPRHVTSRPLHFEQETNRAMELTELAQQVAATITSADEAIDAALASCAAAQPIVVLATAVLGSRAAVVTWLSSPVPALNGRTPIAVMAEKGGVRWVSDTLERIAAGAYA